MNVIVRKSGPQLSDLDIENFEKLIGAELPVEYIDFMIVNNGGIFRPRYFNFWSEDGGSSLSQMFPLGTSEHSIFELCRIFESPDQPRLKKQGFLPIGIDSGGNYIYLKIRGRDEGGLFLLDSNISKKTIKLANTFKTFVDGLSDDPPKFTD